jgi:Mn-dependent DtxR family transcriptional regulator
MTDPAGRQRNLMMEKLERDSFVFLQHMYTLSDGAPERVTAWERVAADLQFPRQHAHRIVEHLSTAELLRSPDGLRVWLTELGCDYIERLAWRRNTVRIPATSEMAASSSGV